MYKKKLILLVIALLTSYLSSAIYSFHQIHKGIYYNDKTIIKEYVEWDKLRENFKNYFNIQLLRESEDNEDLKKLGEWSILAATFASKILDYVIDTYLNPEGLSLLLEKYHDINKVPKPNLITLIGGFSLIDFSGHSSFIVIHKNKNKQISIIFDRIGLKWKITEIIFPDNFLKDMQNKN